MNLFQLAQGGGGGGVNYVRLIGFLIVVGFSVLSWVLRKLQEQAAKKKVQDEIEKRELELLRTGRAPSTPATTQATTPPAASATTTAPPTTAQTDVERRIEDLRRRREAMARRRAEGVPTPNAPPTGPVQARPPAAPAPRTERPVVFVPGSSGPIVPPRPRATPPVAPSQPRAAPVPPKAKRPTREEQRETKPAPRVAGRGTLAERLERRDAAQAAAKPVQPAAGQPVAAQPADTSSPMTPTQWRRAIVARELLAPPISVRADSDLPPGLFS
jgi:hypothetical protein